MSARLGRLLTESATRVLSYPEVGATADDVLPAGYDHQSNRVPVAGDDFAVARERVLGWAMQGSAGFAVHPPGAVPEPGATFVLVLGRWPVRIVARPGWSGRWTSRTGWASPTAPCPGTRSAASSRSW